MKALLTAAVAVALCAFPATAAPLSVNEAIAEAMATNPTVAASIAGEDAARAELTGARGAWLPRIDASDTVIRSNNPVFVFGSLLEQGRFGAANFDPAFLNDPGPLTNHRLALNARLTVFDQFRRLNANRIASNGARQASYATDETRQAIQVETLSRFYGVVLAAAKKRVAESAVLAGESGARAMRDRFEQGLLVESDLLSAEVQLGQFRQQLLQAEGELATARASLNATLGRDIIMVTEVDGTLERSRPVTITIEDALATAASNRGASRAAGLSVRNASLQVQSARGAFLPRLDTFASWNASGRSATDRNADHTIGFVAAIDIFDPSRYARLARARAELASAEAAARAERDRISLEVVRAWHRVRSASQRIELATTAAEQAEAAARIVHDRYENGLTTITEELRAQTTLVGAQLDLLSSRYDLKIGNAELLRATGGLHDVDQF